MYFMRSSGQECNVYRGAMAMAFAFHQSGSGSISDGSTYGYSDGNGIF